MAPLDSLQIDNYIFLVHGKVHISLSIVGCYFVMVHNLYFLENISFHVGTTEIVDYSNYDDMKPAIKKLHGSEFHNAYPQKHVHVKEYAKKSSRSTSRSPSNSRGHNRSCSRGHNQDRRLAVLAGAEVIHQRLNYIIAPLLSLALNSGQSPVLHLVAFVSASRY